MGTFASIFVKEDRGIYEDKINEFAERVEKVFQSGGMMEAIPTELFGKKIITINKAKMTSTGMKFCYNYFEDEGVWILRVL